MPTWQPSSLDVTAQEHLQIIKCIEKCDTKSAEKAAYDHVSKALHSIHKRTFRHSLAKTWPNCGPPSLETILPAQKTRMGGELLEKRIA